MKAPRRAPLAGAAFPQSQQVALRLFGDIATPGLPAITA